MTENNFEPMQNEAPDAAATPQAAEQTEAVKNDSGVAVKTAKNPFASFFGGKKKGESPLIKKENDSFFKKNRFVFLAFAVPLVLMTYSFAVAKFYPFGDNQIMVIDMWHQFFEFFKILHEKLQNFGSLLYTWDGGLGTNFIALISYYAASPLYLLSVFVPTEFLTEALAVVVILKISFSGAFMCIYLRSMFKRCDFGTATFSILYALSAFAMGYYWCVMWLDVMALLPLCLLGLNKLVDEGKFKLYVLSLALMLISNYYIGIMMCMFIVVYYPVIYFSRLKPRGAKYLFAVTVKTAFFSALAACIAAVILIPTYFSMQNTYYIEPSFPQTNSFYNPILDVVSNLLPNVDLTVRGGLPNIYCGVISFMMAVLFLLCKKIPVRQKVLNCSVLAFLILSFNWNKLDYIWHCLHFPNELPYRYSFAFTFVLITMAYQAYLHLDDLTPGQIGGVTAGGFIYMILAEKLYSDKFDYTVIYVSLGILAAYAIVLAIHKTGKYKQVITGVMLFVVAFAEMTNYTISSVQAVGSSSRSGFYANYDDVTSLIEKVEKDDPSFYRMEIANHWTTNDPALYGYRGVAQFSSEINAKVTALMKSIGLAGDPASNRFGYAMSTPVVNSMLNIKYIIGRGKQVNDFALGNPIYKSNQSTIYRNKYDLSIGYMANDDILDWSNEYQDPFDVQNQFVWYATGVSAPVFEQFGEPVVTASGVSAGQYISGTLAVTSSGSGSGSIQLQYVSPKTQPVYAFVTANGASAISASVGGRTISYESNRGSANSLGTVNAGEVVNVNITYEADKAGDVCCYIYGLNEEVWNRAYAAMSDEILKVTDYSDTKIKGTISVKQDGVFATSIPYEKGWTIKVDGKKVDTYGIKDALLACDLKAGNHEIEMSYRPYGFYVAVFMSVTSLIALFVIDYLLKRLKEKKPNSFLVAVPNDKGLLEEYPISENCDAANDTAAADNLQAPPLDDAPQSDTEQLIENAFANDVASEASNAAPEIEEAAAPTVEDEPLSVEDSINQIFKMIDESKVDGANDTDDNTETDAATDDNE